MQIKISLAQRILTVHRFSPDEKIRPGVVFLPDLTGVGDVLLESAQLLSQEGYHVFVPDLYSEEGIARYCMHHFFDLNFLTKKSNSQGMQEIHELIDALKKTSGVDAAKLGLIGQCLTGGFALHCALRDDVKAPIVFHHSLGITGSGIPETDSRRVCKPVQGHYVTIDPICPKARVDQLKEELGAQFEVNYYSWLPHGIPHFFRRTNEGRRAWTNMIRFLKMQLG